MAAAEAVPQLAEVAEVLQLAAEEEVPQLAEVAAAM